MSFSAKSVIALLVLQVTAAPIGRFGSVGRTLSQSEVAQISDLGNRVGKAPWIILGDPSMIAGVAFLTVYLHPDVVNERLHRGRVLRLIADTGAAQQRNGPWKVKDRQTYAYVVPPEGHVGEIRDERDINWPFPVQGEIDDDTLINIVMFVRSKPPIPGAKDDQPLRQVVGAPISGVARLGNQFVVGLRTSEATGHRVTLIRKGDGWVITDYGTWIV